nr:hypothetical protein [Tanacetum cinerariifolium]
MELVLDCVIPYIKESDDLNSVSLVSKNFFDIDSKTRKHVTVHVHFLPDPKRLSCRFPNLESLTLKSCSYGFGTADKCCIPVTPWILEIAVEFTRLKSLCIRNMVVSASDLKLLAKTRGGSLRSLEIRGCKMFSDDGLIDIASGVKFPSNIRALHIQELREASFPFLLPYLNQLRELDIECADLQPNCLCFLIQRCPRLEVLVTQDIGGDEVLQVIGQICKKLR